MKNIRQLLMLVLFTFLTLQTYGMNLFVQTPNNGTISLDVEPSDSGENVKNKIFDQISVPVINQVISWNGTTIQDGQTLADVGIVANNSTITLTVTNTTQVPEKMSYQAVVRNTSNNLVTNQPVGMQISILQGSATGTAVYVETQTPTSNANGLVTLEIGGGTVVSGNMATINWANGPYFIKTETDPTGGSSYTITGTSQLLSTPYALYAKTSGSSTPGPQGPAGANGLDGATGPMGPQGPQGLTGPQGPAGANGLDGATGPMGPQGIQGPVGPMGPQGPAGANGLDGATGPMGPQGIQGPVGPAGANGLDGATGPMGPQGPIGLTGAAGPQGPAGVPGANGQGVPTGGTTGQVLAKVNATDYNTQWVTPSGGTSLPAQTGNAGKVLTTDGTNLSWTNAPILGTLQVSPVTSAMSNNIVVTDLNVRIIMIDFQNGSVAAAGTELNLTLPSAASYPSGTIISFIITNTNTAPNATQTTRFTSSGSTITANSLNNVSASSAQIPLNGVNSRFVFVSDGISRWFRVN